MSGVGEYTISGRDRSLLRAIAAERCQLGSGCEPVLLVDGLVCADFTAGHRLVAAGLIMSSTGADPVGPVTLTQHGRAALESVPH